MITVAFITANYVARQLDYHMTEGWMQGDTATQDFFRPVGTFPARFDAMLGEIRTLGFDAVSLWVAHLHPSWATDEHIRAVQVSLKRHRLRLTGLAGGFGATPQAFEETCRLASALGVSLLEGNTPLLVSDRRAVVQILQRFNLRLGIENHPEKTPQEVLAKVGDGGMGHLGATVDTGWFGTQGYHAALAIEELGQHVFSVHLKDVLAAGSHDTCRFGKGVVPIQECVQVLQRIGYNGVVSIEHEPESYDPTPDIKASLEMLQGWLS
jgi:sugar phosphate isomerase/epimerase